jgi:hypothetical protein
MEGGKMTKKRTFVTLIVTLVLCGIMATSALAQYPPDISTYPEKYYYTQPIYAKAQDWVRCSLANYFADESIYVWFTIYNQDGLAVYETVEATPYEVDPWGVKYDRYQVTADGSYWCWVQIKKPTNSKYTGWGSVDYSYEPAALGYEVTHVPASPAD